MASAELALEAKNTLPSSFDSDRRGDFQRPGGLIHTPQSPVSNINRIRPASPLQTGLVQPWVQSEGSCLASATPFNVSTALFLKFKGDIYVCADGYLTKGNGVRLSCR